MPNVEGLPDLADLPVLVIPGVDKKALWLGDCGVFVGQVHTHPITMNWWMAGHTCHPINKPYEITAALLERSCATASSPVYLNWSAPHMSSHTSWKNQVINFELSYLGIPSMNPLSRRSTFWKYCYLVATKLPISRECSKFQCCWKHLTTSRLYNFFNRLYKELCHFRCRSQHPVSPDLEGLPNLGDLPHLVLSFDLMYRCHPDSEVHGAYMEPTWGRQDPSGPHVGPMNFAIRDSLFVLVNAM